MGFPSGFRAERLPPTAATRRIKTNLERLEPREVPAYFPISATNVNLAPVSIVYTPPEAHQDPGHAAIVQVKLTRPGGGNVVGGFGVSLYWINASGHRTLAAPEEKVIREVTPRWKYPKTVPVLFDRSQFLPRPADARQIMAVVDAGKESDETDERDNEVGQKLPLIAVNKLARLVAARGGASVDGTFSSLGSDTLSGDRIKDLGRLDPRERDREAGLLRSFLEGRLLANDGVGRPSADDIVNIIDPILRKFLDGSPYRPRVGNRPAVLSRLDHLPGKGLSELVGKDARFAAIDSALTAFVKNSISYQAARGRVDFGAVNLDGFVKSSRASLNYPQVYDAFGTHLPIPRRDIPFTLRAVLGGTQGMRVSLAFSQVAGHKVGPKVASISYRATIRYEIFDVFGANHSDRYAAPLLALYNLHHLDTRAKPFINRVVIDTFFGDSVPIPGDFESAVIARSGSPSRWPVGSSTPARLVGDGRSHDLPPSRRRDLDEFPSENPSIPGWVRTPGSSRGRPGAARRHPRKAATDAGLAALPECRQVTARGTGVTAGGAAALMKSNPEMRAIR